MCQKRIKNTCLFYISDKQNDKYHANNMRYGESGEFIVEVCINSPSICGINVKFSPS